MDEKKILEEEALKLINGGVLEEGWESSVISLMALYKGKYGEEGKWMIMEFFFNQKPGEGSLTTSDIADILVFIDHNWDSVEPQTLPF